MGGIGPLPFIIGKKKKQYLASILKRGYSFEENSSNQCILFNGFRR